MNQLSSVSLALFIYAFICVASGVPVAALVLGALGSIFQGFAFAVQSQDGTEV